jgi:hypothetical protein
MTGPLKKPINCLPVLLLKLSDPQDISLLAEACQTAGLADVFNIV